MAVAAFVSFYNCDWLAGDVSGDLRKLDYIKYVCENDFCINHLQHT